MKLKKSLWATASVIVLAYTTPAFTNDTDKVVNATGNMFMDTMNRTGIFEWISGGVGYTDKTLNWDITAFSNLRETKDTVTYVQTSYNRQKSVNRLNLGLGYRKRIDTTATPLIVGVNAFFDSKDGTKNILAFKASDTFQRFSVGAELKTARFDMAANLYRRIGNTIIDDKKVLQGWDITAKGNIPNYEQVSVGVGTYRFDGVEDTVVRGNKLIAEFTPNAMITVRGTYDKPNGESAQTDISVDFKLAFGKSIQDQLQSAPVPSAGAVWHKRYDKVERQYDIKTAEVDTPKPVGDTVQSADIQDSTGDKTVRSGDGTTQNSAYALTSGKTYAIDAFIGNVPSGVTPTVNAEIVGSGTSGTDFQFKNGSTNIDVTNVTYTSTLEDKAGAGEVTLKLTYTADGFNPYEVFIKTQANPTIGSILSDSDKASNDIKGGNGTSQATAYTLTNATTYNLSTFVGTVPSGVTPTVNAEIVGSGTTGTDFQFKNGLTPINANAATYTSTLEDKAGAGAATLKLTYSATDFNDRIVYVKTDSAFTGTLTMADLVVPYGSGDSDRTVTTSEILGQLSVSGGQTQKSQWTLVSVANTDNNDDLAVGSGGKTLIISDEITTKTTVTAVFSHPAYANKTVTFELSTEPSKISTGGRTGSGKWGKTYTTDYKLRTSVGSVNFVASDYTFSIVASGGNDGSGKTPTTAGIIDGNDYTGAINIRTGAITASKLTKSGSLLIKIVRAAKGTGASRVDAVTEYQNFTVSKQQASDHTGFAVSAGAITWNANSQTVSYTEANKPAGIGNATYALTTTGTTAGPTSGGNAITVASSDGKIAKTSRGGVVKVNITYAANDKYETITRNVDVTVNKQTVAANTLSVAPLVVTFVSGTKKVTATDVLGQLTATGSARSDWSVQSLADTDNHTNVAVTDSGKSLTISGAGITSGTTTITVVFESTKYADVTKTFELSTTQGQITSTTPTGSGKWGKNFAINYNLKGSDLNQTFSTAMGDYTFSIITGGDDGSGLTPTTTGIITGANAINSTTGVINANKLTRGGTLLVKIIRRAKNTAPKLTEYYNFTVAKQVLGTDVTTRPAVAKATGENGAWKDSTVTKIDLNYTLPGGTKATQYTWAVAKKSSDAPDGTLNIVNGDIRGAKSGGTVEITMTATPSNPKYSGSIQTADFTIAKQNLADLTTKPSVTASQADRVWKASGAKLSGMAYNNVPGGSVAAFDWSVVGKTGDTPSGTLSLDTTDKKLKGAESGGTVIITMKAKASDKKYTGQVNLADFTIAKQNLADLTTKPSVTASQANRVWKASGAKLSGMAYNNVPGGSVAAFDWSVVGKTGDVPSGTLSLDTTDKKLKGAESGGTVIITMKAKASDKKYTGQVNLADFTIGKQDYSLVIDTKYASATGALNNRMNTRFQGGLRFDSDQIPSRSVLSGALTAAQIAVIKANTLVTVTKLVNDITGTRAAVIDTTATQDINIFVEDTGVITGNENALLTAIATAIENGKVIQFETVHDTTDIGKVAASAAKKGLKLRIQIGADSGKKYNAFDDILYLVTAD